MCFKENEKIAEGMFGNMLNTTALACYQGKAILYWNGTQ